MCEEKKGSMKEVYIYNDMDFGDAAKKTSKREGRKNIVSKGENGGGREQASRCTHGGFHYFHLPFQCTCVGVSQT